MKNEKFILIQFLVVFLLAAILMSSCDFLLGLDDDEDTLSSVTLTIDLAPLFNQGKNADQVTVQLQNSNTGATRNVSLTVNPFTETASGTVTNIDTGSWSIQIWFYYQNNLVAQASGSFSLNYYDTSITPSGLQIELTDGTGSGTGHIDLEVIWFGNDEDDDDDDDPVVQPAGTIELEVIWNISSVDPEVSVNSPALLNGEAGQNYQFEFTAVNLPNNLSQVVFEWAFGTGAAGSSGSQTVSVSGGQASHTVSYTYNAEGMYALVVAVIDTAGNVICYTNTTVTIGEAVEREFDINVCNTWQAATQGGQGVTIDNWDISGLPAGTTFDIYFDAYSIPDKYVVTYAGTIVLDTGWRGASNYDGNSMYPGGVISPGSGEEENIFTKITGYNTFQVTVYGPDPGTAWNYYMRANCN